MSSSSSSSLKQPNILISGTPGTGKSTLAAAIAERVGFRRIDVGELIKEKGFHKGRDEEFDTLIFDEASADELLDYMEPLLAEGGYIIDYHSVDFFPERWFQLILVLRANNTVLYDRLVGRGYSSKKIEENVTAEIMCVVAEEARASYKEEIVHEVESNTLSDIESSCARIVSWLDAWRIDNGKGPASSSATNSSSSHS